MAPPALLLLLAVAGLAGARHHHDAAAAGADAADRLRLEAVKRQILGKLGLRQRPNVTHPLPRRVVFDTLHMAQEDAPDAADAGEEVAVERRADDGDEDVDADDFYGRTSEIIAFAEEGPLLNKNRLLEFQISGGAGQATDQGRLRVRAAHLWLRAERLRSRQVAPRCRQTSVFVFRVTDGRLTEAVTLSTRQFDRVTSDPATAPLEDSDTGWQKVDVTEAVRQWFAGGPRPDDRLRLFVDCSCCAQWRLHLLNGERADENRPFLVVRTDPGTARRVRRRAIDCSVDSGNQCCKEKFYVSFKDLGWDDWVIAPLGYHANFCKGDCGHHRTPDTYVTYHTHVIEEVRKTQHLSGMTPCCAPLKFSSMSLIYYGPQSVIIKRDLPKMVVDECGCP